MNRLFTAVALLALLTVCQSAEAQLQEQTRVQGFRAGRYTSRFTNRGSILSRPTVSPYLALTNFSGNGGDVSSSYFTQVRPQLANRALQQRQQRSIGRLQQNVTSIGSAVARANTRQGFRGTGHPTRFNTYLQYYPGLGR